MNNDWRQKLVVPLCCPICERIMKGSKSNITYYNYNCCVDCFIEFVEGREEKWKSGWRPDKERIQQFYNKIKA